MLRQSIDAFVNVKAELVPEIVARDHKVDEINRQAIREMTREMVNDPQTVTRALSVLVIAKSLERIADHAKNIAEEVFYLHRGEDIRHEQSLKAAS
jgi:phosphate transport system protein